MGERYQFHVAVMQPKFGKRFSSFSQEEDKEDEYEVLFARSYHCQWCWGPHIIRNLHRICQDLSKMSVEYPDYEDIGQLITSLISTNRWFDGTIYPMRIHEQDPYPIECGDSNHGCCIIKVVFQPENKRKFPAPTQTVEVDCYSADMRRIKSNRLWKDSQGNTELHESFEKQLKEQLDSLPLSDNRLKPWWDEVVETVKENKKLQMK